MISFYNDNIYINEKDSCSDESGLDNFDIHGYSTSNEYIPFYSAWTNVAIYNKKIIHYSIPDLIEYRRHTAHRRPIRNYDMLMTKLKKGTVPFRFQMGSMEKPLYVMKGLLFELKNGQPIIHLLIGVKSDYIFKMGKNSKDLSQFALFLSTDFTEGRAFDNVYKRLKRDSISSLQRVGIDTIVTNNIHGWCYKNSLPKLGFNTIGQREEFLETFRNKVFEEKPIFEI